MSLPELGWQIVYGRLAWTLVLAALLCMLVPAARRSRGVTALILAALGVANALPGDAAPAYWMGLAFQLPSAWLAALCTLLLVRLGQGKAAATPLLMPLALAAPVVLIGVALYLDAMGLLALGWYYLGFGPAGAPLAAVLLAAGCAWAIVRGVHRAHAAALLAALCLFALLRLPTGNLWDALLDPFLVAWALVSLVVTLRRRAGTPSRLPA